MQCFHITTSNSGPTPSVLYDFDLKMCFSQQRRAIFPHLNFKPCSENAVSCTHFSVMLEVVLHLAPHARENVHCDVLNDLKPATPSSRARCRQSCRLCAFNVSLAGNAVSCTHFSVMLEVVLHLAPHARENVGSRFFLSPHVGSVVGRHVRKLSCMSHRMLRRTPVKNTRGLLQEHFVENGL